MGQQPISNELLVHMLRYEMRRNGYNVTTLAKQLQLSEDDLQAVLDKRAYATVRLLARLSVPFGPSWRSIAIQHTAWRFDHELAKLSKPAPQPLPKPSNLFQQLNEAKQLIAENPTMEVGLLTDLIHRDLLLDKGAIRNQIAYVRGQQTRGYNFHG